MNEKIRNKTKEQQPPPMISSSESVLTLSYLLEFIAKYFKINKMFINSEPQPIMKRNFNE